MNIENLIVHLDNATKDLITPMLEKETFSFREEDGKTIAESANFTIVKEKPKEHSFATFTINGVYKDAELAIHVRSNEESPKNLDSIWNFTVQHFGNPKIERQHSGLTISGVLGMVPLSYSTDIEEGKLPVAQFSAATQYAVQNLKQPKVEIVKKRQEYTDPITFEGLYEGVPLTIDKVGAVPKTNISQILSVVTENKFNVLKKARERNGKLCIKDIHEWGPGCGEVEVTSGQCLVVYGENGNELNLRVQYLDKEKGPTLYMQSNFSKWPGEKKIKHPVLRSVNVGNDVYAKILLFDERPAEIVNKYLAELPSPQKGVDKIAELVQVLNGEKIKFKEASLLPQKDEPSYREKARYLYPFVFAATDPKTDANIAYFSNNGTQGARMVLSPTDVLQAYREFNALGIPVEMLTDKHKIEIKSDDLFYLIGTSRKVMADLGVKTAK